MTISQSDRYDLQQHLQTVLGEKMGNMLMEHLPPSGWSDVARTRDIDMIRQEMRNLEIRLDARIDRLEAKVDSNVKVLSTRLDMLEAQVAQLNRRVTFAISTGTAMFATILALLINLQFSV